MKAQSESQRTALLTRAEALLRINEPARIAIDGTEGDVAYLGGLAIRITFELPGVVRVYDKFSGQLLAESEPGQPTKPARVTRC